MLALDTNTLIYYFKGIGRVADRLRATSPRDVAIPAIVLYELEVGIARSPNAAKRRADLDRVLSVVRLLPFDEQAARCAAGIRAELAAAGAPIGPLDMLIAGTALAHSAALVTHSTAEFSRVKGLRLLDWY